uniref:Uncharacterized protein n=1 Tax=Cacopsylla melanoneura TaxID=428564 RepID=A0A8D8LM19_9HEMI
MPHTYFTRSKAMANMEGIQSGQDDQTLNTSSSENTDVTVLANSLNTSVMEEIIGMNKNTNKPPSIPTPGLQSPTTDQNTNIPPSIPIPGLQSLTTDQNTSLPPAVQLPSPVEIHQLSANSTTSVETIINPLLEMMRLQSTQINTLVQQVNQQLQMNQQLQQQQQQNNNHILKSS